MRPDTIPDEVQEVASLGQVGVNEAVEVPSTSSEKLDKMMEAAEAVKKANDALDALKKGISDSDYVALWRYAKAMPGAEEAYASDKISKAVKHLKPGFKAAAAQLSTARAAAELIVH